MSFNITYKPFFSVEILHHFLLDIGNENFEGLSSTEKKAMLHKYDVGTLLDVVPAADTAKDLNNLHALFKRSGAGFRIVTLMDGDGVGKALTAPDENLVLNFLIVAKDPAFYTVSNIPFQPQKTLFFTNYNQPASHFPDISSIPAAFDPVLASEMAGDGNEETFAYRQGDMLVDEVSDPGQLFLANVATNEAPGHADWENVYPSAGYDNGTHYNAGDVVWFDDGSSEDLYEAKVDSFQVNPANIANWEKLTSLPLLYASQSDLKPVKYHQLEYSFSVFDEELTVSVADIQGNQVFNTTFTPVETVATLVISGTKLREGLLRVEVKDGSDAVVLTDEVIFLKGRSFASVVGLVQISVSSPQQEYKLLNNDDTLRSPVFRIRIKNRKTNWRYYSADGAELLETQPNPLVANGYVKIQIDGKDVPNPGYTRILPTNQKNYSDVFLNS
jgi:hypothetical protein